jgi:hypothetical protein
MSSTSTSTSTSSAPVLQNCTVCSAPCRSAARPTCSLRCSWKTSGHCVQCGRKVKQPEGDQQQTATPYYTTFCGPLCCGEARRGNWCIGCGVKQVSTQGVSRCSNECMSIDIPFAMTDNSAFPSRRTTPDDKNTQNNNNNSNQQQQQQSSSRPNSREIINDHQHQQQNQFVVAPAGSRVTCSAVQPGSKLWDRITTPFHRQGLQCFQVIKVNNSAADKKAYNAYRLACDQKISAARVIKYGFGGEGCEHKRFYSLMPGCGAHLWGLRLAGQVPPNQQQQQKDAGEGIEGFASTCQDPYCDVCRILDSGLKLTSIAGRPSHFSVPTLESVLPWCNDTASTVTSTHFSPVDGRPYQYTQRFQAVALVRTALGTVHVVNDMKDVAIDKPPQNFDSVVMVRDEDKLPNQPGTCKTDSAFTYNDQSILCEYIVLFDNNPVTANSSMIPPPPIIQKQMHQQQLGNTSSLNSSSSSEQPMF